MLLERGVGGWRGTYLVDSVSPVAVVLLPAELITEMLKLPVEIHDPLRATEAENIAPTLTLHPIITDIDAAFWRL